MDLDKALVVSEENFNEGEIPRDGAVSPFAVLTTPTMDRPLLCVQAAPLILEVHHKPTIYECFERFWQWMAQIQQRVSQEVLRFDGH
jgi:hypothetical protein